jgi:hypothetical protein
MGNWGRYLELQLQAKSGMSSALVMGGLLGLLSAAITFVFFLIAAFVWLAKRYDPLRLALARRTAPWLDPKLVGGAVQLGRAIGPRKMLPLLAIGVLAAGAATQWVGRDRPEIRSCARRNR